MYICKSVLPVSVAALLVACNHSHDHDAHGHDAHGPEHPEQMSQITVWSDRYEVFAEHPALVAGEPATFITHITDLQTLEPRREGAVKFVLQQGETKVERAEAAPARAGIYLPNLVFPEAGDWQLTLQIPTDGSNANVALGVVKVFADAHDAAHGEFADSPEGLSFLKEQQWKVKTETARVSRRSLTETVRLSAQVRPKPGTQANVVAPLAGQLAGAPGGAFPNPGDRVEADQVLLVLRPTFSDAAAAVAQAEADFAIAKATLVQAESAYQRTKQLAATQARSARELEEGELAYQSAQARHDAAAAILATFKSARSNSPGDPLSIELRAPFDGVLNALHAGPGDLVSSGQKVFDVLNSDAIWLEARVPEAVVVSLGKAANASVELSGGERVMLPVTGEGGGALISLGREVDVRTRTVPLIYEMPNLDTQFRIGQQITLHVATAHTQSALAIPDSALVEEGGWFVAYLQVAGETFEKRQLRLGIRDRDWVEVLSGLEEGERVVTRGAHAIRLSSATGAIPAHGHAH